MSQLRVYISHSAQDNDFCDKLAWALRGAGAEVWYDRHVRDAGLPGTATMHEVMESPVFVLVLSNAALQSPWVRAEFQWALYHTEFSRDMFARTLERLRQLDERQAALYHELQGYRRVVPVVALPIDAANITDDWQSRLDHDVIAASGLQPHPEAEAIKRTVRALAALVPVGQMRQKFAELILTDQARWRAETGPNLGIDEILAQMTPPLRADDDVDDLIARGKALVADQAMDEGRDSPAVWSVVANVAEEQPFGPGGTDIRRGTKHFAPGAKVYCFPALWGDGYEAIQVVGHHRASHRFVTMVMPSKRLTNWRVDLVYSPHVIAELSGHWDGTVASKRLAEDIVKSCIERTSQEA
jgi:hypothetical protein